ncbi:MAG: hypothetical protein ACUVQK_00140 [Thermogutta sp.]
MPAKSDLRRRGFFAVAVLGAVLILVVGTRGYWLSAATAPLLARPITPDFAPTVIWIHSVDGHSLPGQDTLNLLADLQRQHTAEIVVTVGRRSRVVEIGALPPMDEIVRRAAARRGIPHDRIVAVPYRGRQLWGAAEWMQSYLTQRPEARVLFLCETFAGAAAERVLDSTLDADCRGRVAVLEVPDRRFDTKEWWRTRAGVKALMTGYLFGVHGLVLPRPPDPPELTVPQLMDRFAPPGGGAP